MGRQFLIAILSMTMCVLAPHMRAQDLDPRAYAKMPVDMTVVVGGFSYSDGNVVTDPTAPVQDFHAVMRGVTLAVGHTFDLLGTTSQVLITDTYAWGEASGVVFGADKYGEQDGLTDLRLRFSSLFVGAPATPAAAFDPHMHSTVIGTSVTVMAPTGHYLPEKLINIGNNRWALKPELAISQPFGDKLLVDLYAGVWFFTANDAYFPGTSVRKQATMPVVQAHVSYSIQPTWWVAFDATYYVGGRSTVNGVISPDEQNNVRIGATMVVPIMRGHTIKLATSTGAIVRGGANFTTFAVAWQTTFF